MPTVRQARLLRDGNCMHAKAHRHCRHRHPCARVLSVADAVPTRSAGNVAEAASYLGTGTTHASSSQPLARSSTPLNDSQLLQYERDGFVVLRSLLPAADVTAIRPHIESIISQRKIEALRHRLRVLCPHLDIQSVNTESQAVRLLQSQATDPLGFLQFFNLHRTDTALRALVRRPELASTAAQLLGCRKVRLYQDCVFLKDPGYSSTNWHSDLRMAPLDTNAFITAWVPLRPIGGGNGTGSGNGSSNGSDEGSSVSSYPDEARAAAGAANKLAGGRGAKQKKQQQQQQQARGGLSSSRGDSGLVFAVGSHRDFALPFWHDLHERGLDDRNYPLASTGPMDVGDVSWHHGWTLHSAGEQPKGSPRRLALALCFFADGARLLADRRKDPSVYAHMLHSEDAESYADWLPQCRAKGVARHELLPVVWPPGA